MALILSLDTREEIKLVNFLDGNKISNFTLKLNHFAINDRLQVDYEI